MWRKKELYSKACYSFRVLQGNNVSSPASLLRKTSEGSVAARKRWRAQAIPALARFLSYNQTKMASVNFNKMRFFFFFIDLRSREKDNQSLSFFQFLPKCPQQLRLGWPTARSWACSPSRPHACRGPAWARTYQLPVPHEQKAADRCQS